MKKLFISLQAVLFIFILSSCGGQKNTPENQAVTAPAVQSDESNSGKADSGKSGEVEKKAEESKSAASTLGENQRGSQIIDFSMSKLTRKINLSDDQVGTIKGILTKSFTENGEDLNKTYTLEQTKEISKAILVKSHDSILMVLDSDQKIIFNKLGQH